MCYHWRFFWRVKMPNNHWVMVYNVLPVLIVEDCSWFNRRIFNRQVPTVPRQREKLWQNKTTHTIGIKTRAGEPEPVGAGCFWLLGAGASWKKNQEPEPNTNVIFILSSFFIILHKYSFTDILTARINPLAIFKDVDWKLKRLFMCLMAATIRPKMMKLPKTAWLALDCSSCGSTWGQLS